MTGPRGARPPRSARRVGAEWARLTEATPSPEPFEPSMVEHLPEPARRWLLHALAPGTPLRRSVQLRMRGQIKLGSWCPFTASQVLSPDGYVWAATARVKGLPVTGYDRFSSGVGQMRWRLLGMVPVQTAEGADVARSAAGRLVGEVVLAPTTFRSGSWEESPAGDTAVYTLRTSAGPETATLQVDADGSLREVMVSRWGNPDGGTSYGRHPFGVRVAAERTFGGVIVPSTFSAGWWFGTDRQREGEFFRAEITTVTFR